MTTYEKHKVSVWVVIVFLIFLLGAFASYFLYFRHYKTTRDSYVHGNPILINAQVSSYVTAIFTDDTFLVEEGQLIAELDRIDFETSYGHKKAALANAVREVVLKFEQVETLFAELKMLRADLFAAKIDYEDRLAVVESLAVSQEDYIHAEARYQALLAKVEAMESRLKQAIAYVRGTTVATHPMVLAAKEAFIEASVNLSRCSILSPATGIVTLRRVQVGEAVHPSTPLMTVVPIDQMWVNANFKETQLKKIRIGQTVDLVSDMYGYDVVYHGVVEGISGGTGAVFSLLPPQEATGNWIKIVQRLPVRIRLDPEELRRYPLRLGLTMTSRVHLTELQALPQNPQPRPTEAIYSTNVYNTQGDKGAQLADEIIHENSTLTVLSVEDLEALLGQI